MKQKILKVLIVDDENLERVLLRNACDWEKLGCEIVGEAGSGAEALDFLTKTEPHIVLTDVNMPKMNGLEFVKSASERFSYYKTQFVIITGYREFEYARQAVRLDIKEFLLKPLDFNELEKTIARLRKEIEKLEEKFSVSGAFLSTPCKTVEGRNRYFETQIKHSEKILNSLIEQALKTIEEHLFNPQLSLSFVAERIFTSDSYLSRLFKQETNENFSNYVLSCRIKAAIKLMSISDLRAYEIAERIGMQDPHYFSICFKRYTGFTLTRYRNLLETTEGKKNDLF